MIGVGRHQLRILDYYGRIQNTLRITGYKPFKIKPTTKLTPGQREKRVEFCQTMLEKFNLNNDYLKNVFWTDESTFATSGMINRKNVRQWATVNPIAIGNFNFKVAKVSMYGVLY